MCFVKIAAAMFSALAFLFFFQIYPNFKNPSELSRFLLISAIIDDGTLQIDNASKRYGYTMDRAVSNGHLYSDKPIGYSLAGAPVYWALRLILSHNLDSGYYTYALRIFLNLIPLA